MLFLFLSFTIVFSSCADENQISIFWDFVKENETTIINATNQDISLWNELNSYLQVMDKSIYALVSKEGSNTYLVITAGGNKDSFDLCDEIVRNAIKLNVLQPLSLVPPSQDLKPFIYEMPNGNVYFTVDDVSIHSDNYDDEHIEILVLLSQKHLQIIHENKQFDMQTFYHNMCVQMIMQVLGEKLMTNRIASIDVMYLNLVMPTIPLRELPNKINK